MSASAEGKTKPVVVARSFRFEVPEEGTPAAAPRKVKLSVNDEEFMLADDLEGFELLQYVGASQTTNGVIQLLQRTVSDDDWPRFLKTVKYAKPKDFGRIAGEVLDAYSGFPTTREADSSDG